MRRPAAAALLLTLTACVGGSVSSGPAASPPPPAPEPAPTLAPASPTPTITEPGEPAAEVIRRATLTGTVTYLLRIALTPEAVVQVELRDVSRQDSDAPLIAKQVIRRPGQVPISFALEYDRSLILPGHLYAVSARIMDRGQLQFVTETPAPAIFEGAESPVEIVVVPVR